MNRFGLAVLILTLGFNGAGTLSAFAAGEHVATSVEKKSAAIESDVLKLKVLSNEIKQSGTTGIDALQFRKDGRSFKLLEDLDALIIEVAKLPKGSPDRVVAETLLTSDIRAVGDAVFERLKELDNQILASETELVSLGGATRVSQEIYIHSLENIRSGYYKALVKYFDSRKTLGLSSDKLKARLKSVMFLHAEKLAGQLEYATSSLAGLQSQLNADPGNADLNAAMKDLQFKHRMVATNLELTTQLLDRLEVDTTAYRAVLLKGTGELSVELLSVDVLISVLRDGFATLTEALKANAPDLALKLFMFFAIIFVFRYLSRLTKAVVERSCDSSSLDLSALLKDILISGSGGTVMVLGLFMALSQIGISLGPMLAGLGVAGFVIGFALQDTLGNFAAGAMILIYRPYDVDDFIEVTGASGLVKKMNLVSTTITTFDNQTLVVPNSKIWGDVIKNVTAQKVRRVDLEFGIGYTDDIELTERVLNDIVDSHELILKKPSALIKLHTLGDSSVNFIVRPWTKTENYWDVYWDLMREVKMRFDREGISIPFPQRDVHVYKEE